MEIEDLFDYISRTLAARLYYPCILLVHTDIGRLNHSAQQLAQRSGWPQLAVSRTLTDILIDAPPARHSALANQTLDQPLARLRPGPVICTDLALLFERSLDLNPVVLLCKWSRSVPIVACWPGAYADACLTYAVPDHAHYHRWPATELCSGCIVPL